MAGSKRKGGYGVVYQDVMRNKNISPEAKAIYAYLSSIAGSGNSCYPSVDTMQEELCMSKNRFTKHMGQLIAFGVVEKVRERNGNIYGRNTYRITHEVEVSKTLKHIFEAVENEAIEKLQNEAVEKSQKLQNEAIEKVQKVQNEAVETRPVENEAINNNNINNNNNIILCASDAAQESTEEEKPPLPAEEKTALQRDTEDFEKIYATYPKKRGKAKAFEYYRGYVGKGRVISGTRYHLNRKQIYLAVAAYVQEKEEAGTELAFYQDFSTFMNKTILDYLPEGDST